MSTLRRSLVLVAVPVLVLVAVTPDAGSPGAGQAQAQEGTVNTAAEGGRPNILIIMTDDQRAGTLAKMPATTRWFKRGGKNFENAYASTPLCCPSRASVFTGRYTHNHDVRDNASGTRMDHRSTLQRYLNEAGYLTGISGKYFNQWDIRDRPPHFHRWTIFDHGYYGATFSEQGILRKVDGYSTNFVADQALAMLGWFERGDQVPWLLFVTPFAPHSAATPHRKYADAAVPPWNKDQAVFERDRSDKPPFIQDSKWPIRAARRYRRHQYQSLMSVDDLVARVMGRLGKLGERNNTLAFFLSDNGVYWREHGLKEKRLPYIPDIDIPMFMRWPGHVGTGVRDRRLVANIDVFPTAMQAAGVRPDAEYPVDGYSLRGDHERRRMFLEYYRTPENLKIPKWASIRNARYQFVEYYNSEGDIIFREYYDLVADPSQMVNRLEDGDPDNDPPVGVLHDRLAGDRRCRGSNCP